MSRFVGIDLGKRELKAVRLQDGEKHEWFSGKTNEIGIRTLLNWLSPEDTVILEAGNQSFRIARRIERHKKGKVIVLNPGDVATIYKSLKKTDKEDALKLARLAQRNPRSELPEVPVPSENEESIRSLSTEQMHWSKLAGINKNRLHSIFTQAGLTEISKKDLKDHRSRRVAVELLPVSAKISAQRLVVHLRLIDRTLARIENETRVALKENKSYSALVMSMPGIGPITTLSLLAYIGRCERFSQASQLSYYVGLVPRVDISGDTVRYGHILKTGCIPIRRTIIQGAWALVRSKYAGALGEFYQRLKLKKGSKKAIVATARKMLEILFHMLKNGEFYRGVPSDVMDAKLRLYGLT